CGELARPNILMFGDGYWDETRTHAQVARLDDWLETWLPGKVAIIECGAGSAIPSVRRFCEKIARGPGATLIRLNPREPEVPRGQIGLALGALAGLRALDALL